MMKPTLLSLLALSFALDASAQTPQPSPAPPVAVTLPAAPLPHAAATPARRSPKLLEPALHVKGSGDKARPRIALTFDACMGKADERILSVLVGEQIPATIFVTARWLRSNPDTVAVLKAHPDLFELENHGENHVPAIDLPVSVYGIAAAGSTAAVLQEVSGGANAMQTAGLDAPRWFRGSTAKYDLSAIRQIRGMGYRIAGYSVNGDGGSLLGAGVTEKRIGAAKDGDVVIAHINQPTHAAGEGVAKALLSLKRRGVEFVRLSEAEDLGDDETTR